MAGFSPEGEDFAREDAANQEEGVRARPGDGVPARAAACRAQSWERKEKQKKFISKSSVKGSGGFSN